MMLDVIEIPQSTYYRWKKLGSLSPVTFRELAA